MIRFAHMSDTHINHDGKESFLKTDSVGNFKRAVDYLKRQKPCVDFVVVTGDVAHEGDVDDYRFLKKLLNEAESEIGAPIFLTLGNHDNRESFFEGYLAEAPREAYYVSQNIKGLRIIMLDSKIGMHTIPGNIGQAQLEWLRKELETPAMKGTLIFTHHPPGSAVMADHCLQNSSELFSALQGTDVIGIMSGHTHFSDQHVCTDGILSATAASTAFGLNIDGGIIQLVERCCFNTGAVLDGKLYISNIQLADNEKTLATFSIEEMAAATAEEFDSNQFKTK